MFFVVVVLPETSRYYHITFFLLENHALQIRMLQGCFRRVAVRPATERTYDSLAVAELLLASSSSLRTIVVVDSVCCGFAAAAAAAGDD